MMRNYEYYEGCNLNVKLLLTPIHDGTSSELVNMVYDLKNIGIGEHNFNLNINNTTGRVSLLIDGIQHESLVYNFEPNKYRFSDYTANQIVAGVSPHLKDALACKKLDDASLYTSSNMYIRDINVYKKCLDHHDVLCVMRQKHAPIELNWTLPSGLRNHVEKVDRVFNHSKAITKSNVMDLRVRNSKIVDTNIQTYITSKIRNVLPELVPAGVNCKDIHWSNQILD